MDYHNRPTTQLAYDLTQAIQNDNQIEINAIAYELACRFYVRYRKEKTFDELLKTYGYVKIEEDVKTDKIKSLGR